MIEENAMRASTIFAVAVLATTSLGALADPPDHAPAHGWRKKHDARYVGYTGTEWERDYRVTSGSCDREAIGAVLGGVAGGVIGSKVASQENRTVAVIIGAAAGALVGARIGRELDDGDRGCIGHSLEIVPAGHTVVWQNVENGVRYTLVPGSSRKRDGALCRDFALTAATKGGSSKKTGTACQTAAGIWQIV
jgi:surface antigen